jgi:hypothetical protein
VARQGRVLYKGIIMAAEIKLFRLCRDKWLISHPDNAIPPRDRTPIWIANRYHVNPDYPHVYRYCRYPSRAEGGKWLADDGGYADVSSRDVSIAGKVPLIKVLTMDGKTSAGKSRS